MMKYLKTVPFVLFLFVFVPYCNAQTEQLHSYLEVIHAKKHFNGELLVAKGNQILFHEAIGMASVEHNVAMETDAVYRIASITKSFTGTLIAMAEEEKKLHFSDKAIKYIPGLSDKFKDITIHQLLTHTAGLPHNEGIEDYWLIKSKLDMTTEQVIKEINQLDLLFEPGSQTHYSSPGYYLLATILETVYDTGYQTIVENKILNKLDMKETGTAHTLEIIPNMARGYHLVTDDSLVVAPYRDYSMLKGAGDQYSTASDLLKWSSSFFTNTLLEEKTKSVMFTPLEVTNNPADKKYGYGSYINTDEPQKYFHGGGTWGYSSYIAHYPKDQITIIILSNIFPLATESIATDIEKIVYGLPFTMPVVEKAVADSAINVERYAGNYVSESEKMSLRIIHHTTGLFAQLGTNPAFQIYPKGGHNFFGKKVDIQLLFEVTDGSVIGLTAEGMGRTFHFKKTDQ